MLTDGSLGVTPCNFRSWHFALDPWNSAPYFWNPLLAPSKRIFAWLVPASTLLLRVVSLRPKESYRMIELYESCCRVIETIVRTATSIKKKQQQQAAA